MNNNRYPGGQGTLQYALNKRDMFEAIEKNNLNELKRIIKNGADLNVRNEQRDTLLLCAARYGFIDIIDYLIKECHFDVNSTDNNGWTALHLAAMYGRLEACKYLVENGADINKQRKDGWTPLHTACNNGRVDVIKYLVDKRADISIKDIDGKTPLTIARERGPLLIVRYLENKLAEIKKEKDLEEVAKNTNTDVAKELLENGAEVNAKNKDGETALIKAAGYTEIVKLLEQAMNKAAIKDERTDEDELDDDLDPNND